MTKLMNKIKDSIANKKKSLAGITTATILVGLIATYCVAVVMYNLFEMKTIGTATFAIAGGGLVISWLVFLVMDIITEVWGKDTAVKIFTFAAVLNVVIVLIAQLIIALPGTYPEQNNAFAQIFSNGPRIVLASALAFWFGNYVNTIIMHTMKKNSKDKKDKKTFAVRAVLSTLAGQFIDNALFVVLAFAPIGLSLFEMRWQDIASSVAIGTALEVIIEATFVYITAAVAFRLIAKRNKEKEIANFTESYLSKQAEFADKAKKLSESEKELKK